MLEPVSPLGSNHTSLRMWAAYSTRSRGELHSKSEPVAPPPTLSSSGLETIAPPVGGAKIVDVNLTGEMTEEERDTVAKLRKRDAQVRRHEQAHLTAAGQHALGGAKYTYQIGPDGVRYAIGGEVQVDLSPVQGDPEATLRKAQQLQQAALAPVDPSGADRNVAMAAAQVAQDARHEMIEDAQEEIEEKQKERSGKESSGKESSGKAVDAYAGDLLNQIYTSYSGFSYDEDASTENAHPSLQNRSNHGADTKPSRNLDYYV